MTKARIDFRYVEVDHDLWALRHVLDVLEPTIARLGRDYEEQTLEALRQKDWDSDEVEVNLAWQEIRDMQEFGLPRFLRGPYALSLWACFESAVILVADTVRGEVGASSALRDDRRGSFPNRARAYFETVLGLPLELDTERFDRLVDHYQVRNALAHANGLKEGMSEEEWEALKHTISHHHLGMDVSKGAVVLSSDYLVRAHDDVDGSITDLVARARTIPHRRVSGRKRARPDSSGSGA